MQSNSENENVNLKNIFDKLIDKWYWFLLSVVFFLIVAFLYIRLTPPTYEINARVLVSDDEKGGGLAAKAGALMDLGGLLGSKNSVDNEAEIFKTRFLMEQVVRKMQLNLIYLKKSGFVNREIYNPPFKIEIISSVDTIVKTKIDIKAEGGGKFKISNKGFYREVFWNSDFKVDSIGVLRIVPTLGGEIKGDYSVVINSIDERVADLMKNLSVSVTSKLVSVIDIGLSYPVPKKGEDILNVLIDQYKTESLSDKNAIADSTAKFIKERLSDIAVELGDVENQVETFKKRNNLADMSEQGKLLVQTISNYSAELAKAESQVNILNDLEKYMLDESRNKRVFPSSIVPQDMAFSSLLGSYNALLIERDRLLLDQSENSPFVKNIDKQIDQMRKGILSNIQNTKNTYVVTRDKLREEVNKAEGKVEGVPLVEKNYLRLARSKEIKQEIYIFLMQKAEETAISKTSNISVSKTIDPPKAVIKPISPKKSVIYFLALIIGTALPTAFIWIRDLLNTTISTKEDIILITQVPIIGEISHNSSNDNLIVSNQGRSAISEQYRALRTNLSFYLKNEDQKIILLTSSISGEGKSFTAINLGNILALSGKKVLLMELDLRKPGLSAKLMVKNDFGFSNYTIKPEMDIKEIIKPLVINKNMFIISSGPLPPNPAETLMSEHVPRLIQELKKQFDYIILDAPPIGIITDAQLLANYADVTLYLVRQNVTNKAHIEIVEDLYRSNKMKNLGIVVNDITSKTYGYGYGYGQYGQTMEPGFFKKLFKKG